jgi:DNA-binding transcriptional MerR regulator
VSEMVDLPIWTLRKLDDLGVICPSRMGKKTRCYSKVQIQKLHYVRYLLKEKKVNISGIKFVMTVNSETRGDENDDGNT